MIVFPKLSSWGPHAIMRTELEKLAWAGLRSGVMQYGKLSARRRSTIRIKRSLSEFGHAGPENTLLLVITCERVGSSHCISNYILRYKIYFMSKSFLDNILELKTYPFRLNAGYETNQGPSENFQASPLWCGCSIRRSFPFCCSYSFGRWFLVHIEYHRCEELMLTFF